MKANIHSIVPCAAACGILAGHAPAADRVRTFELGEIVVTADAHGPDGRMDDHITGETLRNLERNDLAAALRAIPGVTGAPGGARNEAGVLVRGFDLRQVPVYVDGIPVYVPYDGYVDLARFTTFDSAEVRVNKGFSSVLFGANTMGGAINVVSRRPVSRFEGDLRAGWFEDSGGYAAFNLGGNRDSWYVQLSGSWLTAGSFPLSNDYVPNAREDGGSRDNAYREDRRFSGKVGWTPNATDEYALGFVIQRGEKGNPPYAGGDPLVRTRYWQWPRWDKDTVYLITRTRIAEETEIRTRLFLDIFGNALYAYDNANYNSQLKPGSFRSFYDDWTAGGSVGISRKIAADNTLKAAIHASLDHHDEHNAGFPRYGFEDVTWSFGVEDTHEFSGSLQAVAGLGYDFRRINEARDTNTGEELGGDTFDSFNPQIGLFYDLNEDHRLHATLARKSRFPTIKDRYSYRIGQAVPNPDLEPETALHYEAGWAGDLTDELSAYVNLFASEVDGAIGRVDNVLPGRYQLQNIGRRRNLGFEIGAGWKPGDTVRFNLGYMYLDRKNLSQPAVLPIDSPHNTLFAYADLRPFEWLGIIPGFEYGGGRYSTTYGTRSGSYAVVDLKLEFRLGEDATLSLGAKNILDRDYTLSEGYPEPGRNFFVSLFRRF